MRTKTIILSAAALAAGLLSTYAQVYSANVVGYVNYVTPNGFGAQANPLVASPDNSATNVMPNADGHLDGLRIGFLSSGGSFIQPLAFFDSGSPTGFSDAGANPVPTPTFPIGRGFAVFNGSGSPITNTFVGSVQSWTGILFSNTLVISNNFTIMASPLPVGGQLDTSLQLTNVAGALDGLRIQKILVGGSLSAAVFFDSGSGTGFSDAGANPKPAPTLNVGEALEFFNSLGAPIPWTQKF
jgi:hypothetical protein